MQSCFMFLFATPYLGFKEVLGSFDSLNGDIYLWELCKSQQAAVLFKFPSCSFMEYQQELARQRRNIQVLCWGENLKVQAEQTFIWEVGIYISEQRKPVLYRPNSTMQLVLQCPGSTTQPYWTNKSNIFFIIIYCCLFIYLRKRGFSVEQSHDESQLLDHYRAGGRSPSPPAQYNHMVGPDPAFYVPTP